MSRQTDSHARVQASRGPLKTRANGSATRMASMLIRVPDLRPFPSMRRLATSRSTWARSPTCSRPTPLRPKRRLPNFLLPNPKFSSRPARASRLLRTRGDSWKICRRYSEARRALTSCRGGVPSLNSGGWRGGHGNEATAPSWSSEKTTPSPVSFFWRDPLYPSWRTDLAFLLQPRSRSRSFLTVLLPISA